MFQIARLYIDIWTYGEDNIDRGEAEVNIVAKDQ